MKRSFELYPSQSRTNEHDFKCGVNKLISDRISNETNRSRNAKQSKLSPGAPLATCHIDVSKLLTTNSSQMPTQSTPKRPSSTQERKNSSNSFHSSDLLDSFPSGKHQPNLKQEWDHFDLCSTESDSGDSPFHSIESPSGKYKVNNSKMTSPTNSNNVFIRKDSKNMVYLSPHKTLSMETFIDEDSVLDSSIQQFTKLIASSPHVDFRVGMNIPNLSPEVERYSTSKRLQFPKRHVNNYTNNMNDVVEEVTNIQVKQSYMKQNDNVPNLHYEEQTNQRKRRSPLNSNPHSHKGTFSSLNAGGNSTARGSTKSSSKKIKKQSSSNLLLSQHQLSTSNFQYVKRPHLVLFEERGRNNGNNDGKCEKIMASQNKNEGDNPSSAKSESKPHIDAYIRKLENTLFEVENLFTRLYAGGRKKQQHLKYLKQKQELEEVSQLSFQPQINATSKKLASNSDFYKRQHEALVRRETSIREGRKKLEEKEKEHTFSPEINTSSKQLNRNIDSLINWGKQKKLLLQSQKEEMAQNEQKSFSFHPQLSNRSKKIVERVRKRTNANKEKLFELQGSQDKTIRSLDDIAELNSVIALNSSDSNESETTFMDQGQQSELKERTDSNNVISPLKIFQSLLEEELSNDEENAPIET